MGQSRIGPSDWSSRIIDLTRWPGRAVLRLSGDGDVVPDPSERNEHPMAAG